MNIYRALEEVRRWCAEQTANGPDPDALEVECHAAVSITIGESAPPWRIRWKRRSSAGASAPVAQLRYDLEMKHWALHHGGRRGQSWCSDDDAIHSAKIGPLLDEVASDRTERYRGLGPHYEWPFG